MEEKEFKSLARSVAQLTSEYGEGYRLGLRRHYHGDKFVTSTQHEQRMAFGLDGDPREEMGRGYRDGFAGNPPTPKRGAPVRLSGPRRVSVTIDEKSVAIAERIGRGNISAGVRQALAEFDEKGQTR
jgi:hypothetical protein